MAARIPGITSPSDPRKSTKYLTNPKLNASQPINVDGLKPIWCHGSTRNYSKLGEAVLNNNLSQVNSILKKSGKIVGDSNGKRSVLGSAVINSNTNIKIIESLLKYKADPTYDINFCSRSDFCELLYNNIQTKPNTLICFLQGIIDNKLGVSLYWADKLDNTITEKWLDCMVDETEYVFKMGVFNSITIPMYDKIYNTLNPNVFEKFLSLVLKGNVLRLIQYTFDNLNYDINKKIGLENKTPIKHACHSQYHLEDVISYLLSKNADSSGCIQPKLFTVYELSLFQEDARAICRVLVDNNPTINNKYLNSSKFLLDIIHYTDSYTTMKLINQFNITEMDKEYSNIFSTIICFHTTEILDFVLQKGLKINLPLDKRSFLNYTFKQSNNEDKDKMFMYLINNLNFQLCEKFLLKYSISQDNIDYCIKNGNISNIYVNNTAVFNKKMMKKVIYLINNGAKLPNITYLTKSLTKLKELYSFYPNIKSNYRYFSNYNYGNLIHGICTCNKNETSVLKMLSFLFDKEWNFNDNCGKRCTPLLHVIDNNWVDTFFYMIDKKADITKLKPNTIINYIKYLILPEKRTKRFNIHAIFTRALKEHSKTILLRLILDLKIEELQKLTKDNENIFEYALKRFKKKSVKLIFSDEDIILIAKIAKRINFDFYNDESNKLIEELCIPMKEIILRVSKKTLTLKHNKSAKTCEQPNKKQKIN